MASYDPATGKLVVNVTRTTGSGTHSSWSSNAFDPGPNKNFLNLQVNGGSFADFLTNVKGESPWDGIVITGNQTYTYNTPSLSVAPTLAIAPVNTTGQGFALSLTSVTTTTDVGSSPDFAVFGPGQGQTFNVTLNSGVTLVKNQVVIFDDGVGDTITATVTAFRTGKVTVTMNSATGAGANNSGAAWTLQLVGTTTVNPNTIGTGTQNFLLPSGVTGLTPGQTTTLTASGTGNSGNTMTGTVTAFNPATGALTVNVTSTTGSGTFATWSVPVNTTIGKGQQSFNVASGLTLPVGVTITVAAGANSADSMSGQVVSYDPSTGALVVNVASTQGSGSFLNWNLTVLQTVAFNSLLNDATAFMGGTQALNQAAIWKSLGADVNGVANGTFNSATGLYINGVLVNIRPGIAIKNSGGDITVTGDNTGLQGSNPNGIDLSGSAFVGSVLNQNDPHSLAGHFGQYDEPIVLALRAAGNLNFGLCTGECTSNAMPVLGSLSDGFSQFFNNGTSVVALYTDPVTGLPTPVAGAGASGAATLFDPAIAGAYFGLSRGLGADSASYFLTAGADTAAADPRAIDTNATSGTITIAGVPPTSSLTGPNGLLATTDPLYVYNDDTNGYVSGTASSLASFVDYASLVRTGTGNIDIAASKDLDLQSPLSLIYTAGTGLNVNGSSAQPLAGFTQYNGMLTIAAQTISTVQNQDTLPASTFPTHGGDVTLAIGGNITGAMNSNFSRQSNFKGTDQELPFDMTALGSQLKLQSSCSGGGGCFASAGDNVFGPISALYANDAWIAQNTAAGASIYSLKPGVTANQATPGDYQLAWYTWFPFLENTIGSFGGGNISVKAGGNISLVQFVAPTNARDAGPALVATGYNFSTQTGLYVQGGGNISVTAGGDISGVYTYAQNGAIALKAGGSIGSANVLNSSTQNSETIPLMIETSTGDVSLAAGRSINIADVPNEVEPSDNSNANGLDVVTLPGLSLIQNANFLANLIPAVSPANRDATVAREITVLSGILTSIPTGTVSMQAVGDITLDVTGNGEATARVLGASVPGLLPPTFNAISLQGNVTNQANFTTFPAPTGTVNLLARGSVALNAGFQVSDANSAFLPTLASVVADLGPADPINPVSSLNAGQTTVSMGSLPLAGNMAVFFDAVQPLTPLASIAVLQGDAPVQLIVDTPALFPQQGGTNPYGVQEMIVSAQTEKARHAGLHAGQSDPARIIALNGDVTQGANGGENSFATPFEDITRATEVVAGRDVKFLALLGQNNNPTDVTSIIAGRDVTYSFPPTSPSAVTGGTTPIPFAVEIGGPGNLLVQAGRNIDLGNSGGIQSFGDLLNASLKGPGASITIEAGLGSNLTLDYANFAAQFFNPATDAANPFAEPVQGFNGLDPVTYFNGLSSTNRQLLLNRVFFALLRDSGREHTGTIGDTNTEVGESVDTVAQNSLTFVNYERAFAAVAALVPNSGAKGDVLGGLSTVRTRAGGDITILAPHGQVEVGLASLPPGFNYTNPTDPTFALDFGVVTEAGGNIDIYANQDVSVNQSRVFTLDGGDLTVVSLNGNIDAGKGAKTVQAIQPPTITYDVYGNVTVTPFKPSSGSGLAVLRSDPGVPLGNADLIAMNGFVDAGDAGIRVSGNLNVAALTVLNSFNITVGGKATGVPVVQAPPVTGLTAANNVAGAAAKSDVSANGGGAKEQPSIIIVEVLGYGGAGNDDNAPSAEPGQSQKRREEQHSYNSNSPYQVLGVGALTADQVADLAAEKRAELGR